MDEAQAALLSLSAQSPRPHSPASPSHLAVLPGSQNARWNVTMNYTKRLRNELKTITHVQKILNIPPKNVFFRPFSTMLSWNESLESNLKLSYIYML